MRAGKPSLYLTTYSQILDLSGFELLSFQQLAANLQGFEGTDKVYLRVKMLPWPSMGSSGGWMGGQQ